MTADAMECGHDLVVGHAQHRGGDRANADESYFDVTQWRHELNHVHDPSH